MSDESELIRAAERHAEAYKDDDRQDIVIDVLNAFYAGATFNKSCNIINIELLRIGPDPRCVVPGDEYYRKAICAIRGTK